MLHQARAGRIDVAQACLLAFMGRAYPTPEEEAGAGLLAQPWEDPPLGLDGAVLPRDAEPGVEQASVRLDPSRHHIAGHAARRGAGLDGQLQRLRAQIQRLVQPPIRSAAQCDPHQHDQSQ